MRNWKGVVIVLALTGAVAGCASPAAKDALRRVGDIGPRIAADIHPDNPGAEARKDEFLRLADECRKLGE